ncbi:15137_t:CDS:2, partial [Gigaspora rosea]
TKRKSQVKIQSSIRNINQPYKQTLNKQEINQGLLEGKFKSRPVKSYFYKFPLFGKRKNKLFGETAATLLCRSFQVTQVILRQGKTIQIRHVTMQPIKECPTENILEHLQSDYQSNKMRPDIEIKKLFQKEEQEIIGILGEYKNRTLKKDNAIAEYLGIQHVELVCVIKETIEVYDYIQYKIARGQQASTKEIELLEINKNQNQPNKRPCKRKIEARELQKEIVRIDETTHLIERESSTDIVISDKKEVKPTIANDTNEVDELQGNSPKIEPSTSTWQGNIRKRNGRKHQERPTSHQQRGRSPYKFDEMNYVKVAYTTDKRTQSSHMDKQLSVNTRKEITGENPKKIKERSLQHRQNRPEQQTSEEHSTSSFQTSGQILASLLETNEILTYTKEHFISQFKGESLNLGKMPDKWKSNYKPKDHIQKNIHHSVNEVIMEEKWEQAVSTTNNMLAPRQVSFKPKSIEWEVKGKGSMILELMNPKLNFKAAKTLEKFNLFYANQLILQDNKTLAAWSQLKLVKSATNLKGLAISNLQSLLVDKRIKDWVITKEMDSEHTLGHIVKKNSNSCDKCALSIDPAQDTCTLRLSKNKILGTLPKSALELSSKTTKIKTNLWQGVQNQQQSNHESALLELKSIEWPEIQLIQNQYFNNKLSLQLIEELGCNIYRNKET